MMSDFKSAPLVLIRIIGLLGLSAIILGTAGAHAIHDPIAQALIEKASFYQLIHTVALLALLKRKEKIVRAARACWISGVLLFSGSLYLKAFAAIASVPLAPLGGMLLMAGWFALTVSNLRDEW